MPTPQRPNTPASVAKVEEALREIESAQRHLEAACRAMSSLVGGAKRWSRVGRITDKVKAEWYSLNDWIQSPRGLFLDNGDPHGPYARKEE